MTILSLVILASYLCVGGLSQKITLEDCPPSQQNNVFVKVYEDTCYYFHLREKNTFKQAVKHCEDQGQILIKPNSAAINGYLWFLIVHLKKVTDKVWIRAIRDNDSGDPKYFWLLGDQIPSNIVERILRYGIAFTVKGEDDKLTSGSASDDEIHPFVCEYRFIIRKTTAKPVTSVPTMTPIPTVAPVITSSVSSLVDRFCPILEENEEYMKLFGSTCFYFNMKSKANYSGAEKNCEKYGGTLAILKTEMLDAFIRYHMNNSPKLKKNLWIGLHSKNQDTQTKTFLWEDGSPLTYTNFYYSSSLSLNFKAVMIYAGNSKWYGMVGESRYLNYICQFEGKFAE